MKIVLRTLVILAAALVVAAGMYAFGQSSFGQQLLAQGSGRGGFGREGGAPPNFEGRERPDGLPAGLPTGERPDRFAGRGEHGGHGPSLFGLMEVGKNLGIIAASVTLVVLGARLLRLGRRDRGGAHPPGGAPIG